MSGGSCDGARRNVADEYLVVWPLDDGCGWMPKGTMVAKAEEDGIGVPLQDWPHAVLDSKWLLTWAVSSWAQFGSRLRSFKFSDRVLFSGLFSGLWSHSLPLLTSRQNDRVCMQVLVSVRRRYIKVGSPTPPPDRSSPLLPLVLHALK